MTGDHLEDKDIILTPKLFLDEFLVPQGIFPNQLAIPSRAALAFQNECLHHLIDLSSAKPLGDWLFPISEASIYNGIYQGEEVLISKIPPSAPNATAFVECLIYLGVHQIIVTGAAGSIHPKAKVGSMVFPTKAIRGEGTSYCYYKTGINVYASRLLVELLCKSANRNQKPFLLGSTWTTDGIFRETKKKIRKYSSTGVLTIEMEMSALFALAKFRKIDLAGLLVISDTYINGHQNIIFDKIYRNVQQDVANIILEALCTK